MAYTPINWQTGDTITAEKMNKMDNGWSVTTSMQTVFDGELVTEPDESYGSGWFSAVINYDSITVTIDGVEYECNAIDMGDSVAYGGMSQEGPVFTEYPFAINCYVSDGDCYFYTETAETYTLKIEAMQESIETTTEFGKARGYWKETSAEEIFSETVTTTAQTGFASGPISYVFTQDPPASAVVTFDGTEYSCTLDSNYGYGEAGATGPIFTNYPFYIQCSQNGTTLYTATAGTYSISLSVESSSASTSEDFVTAVNSCVEIPESGVFVININMFTNGTEKTWQEILDAFTTGRVCVVTGYGPVLQMWYAGDATRYYMATGATNTNNLAFDPAIWRTAGADTDAGLFFYKYNSQMP